MKTGTFKTDHRRPEADRQSQPVKLWRVGQWQGGEFYGLAPTNRPGAKQPIF